MVADKKRISASRIPIPSKKRRNQAPKLASPHIPHDLLIDILSRLPARCLLRFKSVHSSWRLLISSHDLSIAHLRKSTASSHKFGVIQLENTHTKHPILSLLTIKRTSHLDLDKVALQNPLGSTVDHKTNPRFEVYGSCNGLLLIGVGDKNISNFLLWNPCTGERKNIGRYGTVNLRRYIVGIGYDSFSDNYKVVLVFQSIRNKKTVAVYNLKTDCWENKMNCEFPYMIPNYAPAGAALSHGIPHWQVEKLVDNQSNNRNISAIICYDLAEDKFKEVKLPFAVKTGDSIYLSSFRGFLCVGHFNRRDMHEPCIWIRGAKSWSIFLKCFPRNLESYQYLMPVEAMNGREIVMSLDRKAIALYHVRTGDCETVLLSGYGKGSRVAVYAETLVSPNYYSKSKT